MELEITGRETRLEPAVALRETKGLQRAAKRKRIPLEELGTIPPEFTADNARAWIDKHTLEAWRVMGIHRKREALRGDK